MTLDWTQPGLYVPVGIGSFVFLHFVLSTLAGWSRLAHQFAAHNPPPGVEPLYHKWFVSGRLGWMTYDNALRLSLYPDHLLLGVFFLFRLFHPPLMIPRKALKECKAVKGWFGLHSFEFKVEGVRIVIAGSAGKELEEWALRGEERA